MALSVPQLLVLEEADAEEVGDEDDTLIKDYGVADVQYAIVSLVIILEWVSQLLHQLAFDFGVVVVDLGGAADLGGEKPPLILHVSALEDLAVFASLDGAEDLVAAGDLSARSEHLEHVWIKILVHSFASFALSGRAFGVGLILSKLISVHSTLDDVDIVRLGHVGLDILVLIQKLIIGVVFGSGRHLVVTVVRVAHRSR